MNKVLVRLYVPTIDKKYDIWLPVNKKIYKIINLLVKAIKENTIGYYTPKTLPMLYDKVTGKVYNINLKIIETNIRNGTELILI